MSDFQYLTDPESMDYERWLYIEDMSQWITVLKQPPLHLAMPVNHAAVIINDDTSDIHTMSWDIIVAEYVPETEVFGDDMLIEAGIYDEDEYEFVNIDDLDI